MLLRFSRPPNHFDNLLPIKRNNVIRLIIGKGAILHSLAIGKSFNSTVRRIERAVERMIRVTELID